MTVSMQFLLKAEYYFSVIKVKSHIPDISCYKTIIAPVGTYNTRFTHIPGMVIPTYKETNVFKK